MITPSERNVVVIGASLAGLFAATPQTGRGARAIPVEDG
jgi:predicted oxidoreductase